MKAQAVVAAGLAIGVFGCSQAEATQDRDAAFAEAKAEVSASKVAVDKMEAGDSAAYSEAKASLARSEAALDKAEQLAGR